MNRVPSQLCHREIIPAINRLSASNRDLDAEEASNQVGPVDAFLSVGERKATVVQHLQSQRTKLSRSCTAMGIS